MTSQPPTASSAAARHRHSDGTGRGRDSGGSSNTTRGPSSRASNGPRSYGAIAATCALPHSAPAAVAVPAAAAVVVAVTSASAATPLLLGAADIDTTAPVSSTAAASPTRCDEEAPDADLDARFADPASDLAPDCVSDGGTDTASAASAASAAMPPPTVLLAASRRRLAIAFAGVLLLAFTTSLEAQVTAPLAAYAVSSFQNHSMLSTVYVVQGVVNAVIKPPMAKMADVFGRFEAFLGAILLCVTGYVQMALSQNVQTFAAAQILYSAGITGLQVLQQIFVADTSDLRHRALLASLPDTPFLVTVWIGPGIADALLRSTSWRWGYAMWAIILPLAFLPLGGSLALSAYQSRSRRRSRRRHRHRRSSCLGLARPKRTPSENGGGGDDDDDAAGAAGPRPTRKYSFSGGKQPYSSFRQLLVDLDLVGIIILSAALSMILLPLTLAAKARGGWGNPSILASVVVGVVLLAVVFPAWEARPDWAPHPLIPPTLLRSTTFCAGCGVAFFFFAVFYLSIQPYFYSYLLVAHGLPVATAGRITQTFSFTSTIAAVTASLAIRHLRRYKVFVVTGASVHLLGVSLMMVYRTANAGIARLVATQVAVGLGAGLMSVPAQIGIQASVSGTPQLVAAATAVYLTMGEAGGAVGAAISGALWQRLVPAKLHLYLPEPARQNASAIYSSVVVATSYPWGSPERHAIIRAYQESMTALLTVAVSFCVPVLVLALLMKDYRFDGDREGAPPHGGAHGGEQADGDAGEGLLRQDSYASRASRTSHRNEASSSSNAPGERRTLLSNIDDD